MEIKAYAGILSMDESQENSDRYVDYALEHGINYFDVAPGYGDAEITLGKSIKNVRNKIILACKTGEFSKNEGMKQFKTSLERLYSEHFDVYQLHGLTTMEQLEQAFAKDGIMEFLVKAKDEGLIRNIGFSAHNEDVALKALTLYDFDTAMFPLNWSMNISKGVGDRVLAEAKTKKMGVIALKTLASRRKKEGDEKDLPKCWYNPIDIEDRNLLSQLSTIHYPWVLIPYLLPGILIT